MSVIGPLPAKGSATLHNLQLVDVVEGSIRPDVVLEVRDGRIAAISDGPVGSDAPAIDLRGAFVAPGADQHAHPLLARRSPERGATRSRRWMPRASRSTWPTARDARCTTGITTVRCVAETGSCGLRAARAIEPGRSGRARGSSRRVRRWSAPAVTAPATDDTMECDGADEFARGVRTQIKAGADLIKVMISGGIAGEHETIDTPQLTRRRRWRRRSRPRTPGDAR